MRSSPLRRAPWLLATCSTVGILAAAACSPGSGKESASTPAGARSERMKALIARGDSLQLPGGTWEAPPGDAQEHAIAGFATTLCAAVFITGLDPADAAANVGFFTGPLEDRKVVTDTVIDRKEQMVRLKLPSGVWVRAKRYGSQGCIPLPRDKDSVFFTPVVVKPKLPDAATTPWPMGDKVDPAPWPAGVDSVKVAQALATGFGPDSAMTEAFLVTYRGRIIAERYGAGIGIHTPLESWSMGKSLTGTLVARLIQMGTYTLDQPAPIPEWQSAGDPRQAIRIVDIMRMSSGLRIRAPQDPDYDPSLGYPDHLWYYTGAGNSFQWAATRPQQWSPNAVGRYRNTDPVLANYLVRLGVEKRGEDYRTWPQRNLFDKIGIRDAVLMTDPYGNNLTQGAEYLPARDWARLANLYVQDGVWNGERLLPEGYVDHVKSVAPAWLADGRPVYGGGFMWVNGDGGDPMPKDAFSFRGAGGQSTIIVPDRDLVVVRLGKYRGSRTGDAALKDALRLLMEAVPAQGSAK
ncbi:MAG: serine hydrolase [Gemmatimonadaceae bacterium]|nr:serine hydrolase [Gemmatimonadaceae bacterium]